MAERKWLSMDDLVERYGVPKRTVYAWRAKNKGPKGYVIGRHVRFRSDDVEKWEEAQADDLSVTA